MSDSRRGDADTGGALCARLAEEAGHAVPRRWQVRDDAEEIRAAVLEALATPGVDVVVATGGTGLAPRDVTPEAIAPLLEKEVPGFGELFRLLSFQEIGSASIASRAFAGVRDGRLLVGLPGSPAGCRLALERLVLPEAAHLVAQARRSR